MGVCDICDDCDIFECETPICNIGFELSDLNGTGACFSPFQPDLFGEPVNIWLFFIFILIKLCDGEEPTYSFGCFEIDFVDEISCENEGYVWLPIITDDETSCLSTPQACYMPELELYISTDESSCGDCGGEWIPYGQMIEVSLILIFKFENNWQQ